ncbi:TetR family transcriptional regulator [Curtobacterium sp. NPDC089689]|uniref:TetR family transcriptional regulator n=1 Tax=Curtobacterium sp. NPDC089689 TaxID=3363968 RepID=UPI0037F7702C
MRTREHSRRVLAAAIFEVFAERGFEETTVDDAARAVDISRATYFRYFGSKEDAVIAAVEAASADIAGFVADTPRRSAEDGISYVRRLLEPLATLAETDQQMRARVSMIASTPTISRHLSGRRIEQRHALADALTLAGFEALHARTLAAATLAALDLSWEIWVADQSTATSLRSHLDAVFAELHALPTVR